MRQSSRDIVRRSQFFNDRAKAERPAGPEMIQPWSAVNPGGGGGAGTLTAVILESLSYPDPESPEGTESYTGRDFYNARLSGSAATPWAADTVYYDSDNLHDAENTTGIEQPQSMASVDDVNYRCLKTHLSDDDPVTGNKPDPEQDNEWWEKVEDTIIDKMYGFLDKDIRNSNVWYLKDSEVPIIKIGDDYFILGVYYTGEPENASLRFLSELGFAAAVFA